MRWDEFLKIGKEEFEKNKDFVIFVLTKLKVMM